MEVRVRILILALSLCSTVAFAQATGDTGTRGNTPPGMSTDGSRPADGAIKGGSIVPGESAGIPNTGGTAPNSEERLKRCEQLTGKLRDDCVQKERSAAGGSSAPLPSAPGTLDHDNDERDLQK
jgi:hypothetical protein